MSHCTKPDRLCKGLLVRRELPSSGALRDVAITTDGKIVVAGDISGQFTVLRLHADGSRDQSFDSDGRVNANGKVDTSFASNGLLTFPASGQPKTYLSVIANSAGGRLLLTGSREGQGLIVIRVWG